jgi:hypothetical protein
MGSWVTERIISFEVAGLPEMQERLEVIMQVTLLPFTGLLIVNELEFDPALLPLTCHWYTGEAPPLTGVAVKVTALPEHTGLAEADILTLTGSCGFTVIVAVDE